jgi:hypothetical protein
VMIAEFGLSRLKAGSEPLEPRGDRWGESTCGMTATAVTAVCIGIMVPVSERLQSCFARRLRAGSFYVGAIIGLPGGSGLFTLNLHVFGTRLRKTAREKGHPTPCPLASYRFRIFQIATRLSSVVKYSI